MNSAQLPDGYYWIRHRGPTNEGTTWVALKEDGLWFAPGVEGPLDERFDAGDIIGPVPRLDH